MSIISRIRNNATGLAVGIVAFALVAFIVSDAINNNMSIFRSQDNSVAIIAGNKISFQDYDFMSDNEARVYAFRQNPDNPEEPNTQMREYAKEQIWNQIVEDYTFKADLEKLGLDKVPAEEVAYLLTDEKRPANEMKQLFGAQFSASLVSQYYKMQGNIPNDQNGKISNMLELGKRDVIKRRKMEKYYNFAKSIVYVSSLEAKEQWVSKEKSANFKVVALKFNEVSDSAVKVTDEDKLKWYNENAFRFYNNEETRNIKYAFFNIEPSPSDTAAAQKQFNDFYSKLATANDSAYRALAAAYNLDTNYYGKNLFPNKMIGDSLFNAPIGKTIGPSLENGSYKVYKLIASKADTNYSVKVRHILINWVKTKDGKNNDTAATMKTIDSLMALLKKGTDFSTLAKSASEDPGSKESGGFYDWKNDAEYVPEFRTACRTTPIGQLGIAKTQFGVHIVKPEDRTNKAVKIASYEVKIEAGKETIAAVEKKAEEFRNMVKKADDFDAAAGKTGSMIQTSMIGSSAREVPGIPESKVLVGWGMKGKEGDISDPAEYGNRIIVAVITNVKEKGTPQMDDIKNEVEQGARQMKKAEEYKKRMTEAKAKSKNIVELAINLKKAEIEVENQTFINNVVSTLGNEPKLVGAVFGTQQGQFTDIVEGTQGVYIAFVEKIVSPSEPKDFVKEQTELTQQLKGNAEYRTRSSMRNKADISDKRYMVY